MKRIALLCLLFSVAMLSIFAQPKISFESVVHDFGTFDEDGGNVSAEFRFSNTGNEPLEITSVRATCGCTVPEYSREPIAPGENGVIKVTYNPKGRPGKFDKSIFVYSNNEPSRMILKITGNVTRSAHSTYDYAYNIGTLYLKSLQVPFFDLMKGETKAGKIQVMNSGKESVTPVIRDLPKHITAVFVPEVLHPLEEGILVVTYDAGSVKDWGFRRDEFRIDMADDTLKSALSKITVTANIKEDLSQWKENMDNAPLMKLSERTVDFGFVKGSGKVEKEVEITNEGHSPLIIRKIGNETPVLKIKLGKKKIKPGKSTRLKIEVDPSKSRSNLINYRLIVITNDPHNSSQVIRVLGRLE